MDRDSTLDKEDSISFVLSVALHKDPSMGAEGMVQQLRLHTTLAEDPRSVLITHSHL